MRRLRRRNVAERQRCRAPNRTRAQVNTAENGRVGVVGGMASLCAQRKYAAPDRIECAAVAAGAYAYASAIRASRKSISRVAEIRSQRMRRPRTPSCTEIQSAGTSAECVHMHPQIICIHPSIEYRCIKIIVNQF